MAYPTGEKETDALRFNFDRRLKLEFHGSSVTSDAGLLAKHETYAASVWTPFSRMLRPPMRRHSAGLSAD